MANTNTNCQICGKGYNYCHTCGEKGNWRAYACSPECWQIAIILTDYRESVINAKEATQQFERIGITADSNLSVYLEGVGRDIKNIITKGTPKKTTKKSKVEEPIEEPVVEEAKETE